MVRPVVKFDNRSTEMEIKALKLSSECKDNIRAPAIWEKPTAAVYNYHYEIGGLYYQVKTLLLQTINSFQFAPATNWLGNYISVVASTWSIGVWWAPGWYCVMWAIWLSSPQFIIEIVLCV